MKRTQIAALIRNRFASSGEMPSMRRMPRTRHRLVLTLIAASVVAAFLCVGAIVLKKLPDQPDGPREVLGPIWVAETDAGPRFLVLTQQRRVELDLVRRRLRSFNRFELETHDGLSGERLRKAIVAEHDATGVSFSAEVIGVTGRQIWVWKGDLAAYDCDTLQQVASRSRIREGNAELELAKERRFYRTGPHPRQDTRRPVTPEPVRLIAKTLDARIFAIHPESLLATEIGAEEASRFTGGARTLDEWFSTLWPPGRAYTGLSYADYILNGARLGDRCLLMASDEERSKLSPWFGRPSHLYGEVRRQLYTSTYTLDDRGEAKLDLPNLMKVSGEHFLMGGLLRDPNEVYESSWLLDGDSIVTLSRDKLGEAGRVQLARMKPDGQRLWQTSLGIADLKQLADTGPAVLAAGYADFKEPLALRAFLIALVDKETGNLSVYNLKSEKTIPQQVEQ